MVFHVFPIVFPWHLHLLHIAALQAPCEPSFGPAEQSAPSRNAGVRRVECLRLGGGDSTSAVVERSPCQVIIMVKRWLNMINIIYNISPSLDNHDCNGW